MVPKPLHFSSRNNSINSCSIASQISNREQPSLIIEKNKHVALENWGYPGYLSDEELDVYEEFRTQIYERKSELLPTVFCFGNINEEESYALCRWLRARKFNLLETMKMVQEATECRKDHFHANFYKSPKDALGVELSTYTAQYPQLYSGFAKNGCPLFISKPGVLCTSALECITTVEGIFRYHWHEMVNNFGGALRESMTRNPNFKRFELLCVIDLAHLSASQVSKRALNIIKVQTSIDSLCFPETLNRLLIVNAPGFFSMTWKVISGWVDARTASKVEIYSNRKKAEKRLAELVDESELPSDYGGKGTSTIHLLESHSLRKENQNLARQITKLISLRSSSQLSIKLDENETMHSSVYTRSLSGAKFYITNNNQTIGNVGVAVKHLGKGKDNEDPTRVDFEKKISGPCLVKVRAEKNAKSLAAKNFLFVGKIYDTNQITETEKIKPSKQEIFCERINKSNDKNKVNKLVNKQRLFIETSHSKDSQSRNSLIGSQTPIHLMKTPENQIKQVNPEIFDMTGTYSNTYLIVDERDHTTGSFWSCGWNSCW